MAATIDYFFTPISGYAYLGHAAFVRLAAEAGATVRVLPMDSLKVFAAVGATPPPKQPAERLRYRQADMGRWARHRGLPLVVAPRFWPTDTALAACAIVAAGARGLDLAGALLDAVWARDLDIAQPDVVHRLAAGCGLDGVAILDAARAPETVAAYAANTADAIARGALGSPTFFVSDAMFFGQDRLHFVADAIGAPDGAAVRSLFPRSNP